MKIKKKFEQMINLIFQVFIRQKVDLRNDGRWYFLKIADIRYNNYDLVYSTWRSHYSCPVRTLCVTDTHGVSLSLNGHNIPLSKTLIVYN